MSFKGGGMCRMESVRRSIKEHLTSVGEEILCVLDKQSDVRCCVKQLDVRVFVSKRLGLAADFMFNLFQRETETLETLLETRNKLLDLILQPHVKLHRTDILERNPSLFQEEPQPPQLKEVQEEPQPPQIKEEQEEPQPPQIKEEPVTLPCQNAFIVIPQIQTDFVFEAYSPKQKERGHRLFQEEPESQQIKEEGEEEIQETVPLEADGTMLTLLTVKREDVENRETDPPASTSYARIEDCETSLPTSDAQLLSSHRSESDTEDSDEWEETRGAQSVLNKQQSHKTQHVKEQRLSMSCKLLHGVKSSKEKPSMKTTRRGKPFICTLCGKDFSQKCVLKQHMRIHTGEKPFSCNVCGNCFSREGTLKQHLRIHTGEKPFSVKPFSCNVCGDSFSREGYLKQHVRVHTGESKDGGSSSSKNSALNMPTHTGEKPFSCTVCGSCFGKSHSLKQHMRIHTVEKPVSCTDCGKSFSHEANLKQHMRIHKGENLLICHLCGISFSQIGHLKQHMRVHMGKTF